MGEAAVLLLWPALLGYGEAAVAYAGEAVRPGRLGRYAIWGVRLGWLAQTGLLGLQAARAEGWPWGTWAGSLNLFVWMCVGTYLIWGCRPSFRLLGSVVMPLALGLFVLAWAAGGVGVPHRTGFGDVFLAFHVGLVLAAFAGFTLAAGLAALYLWQERRLKRHEPGVLRQRAPSLAALDRLTGRTILVAVPALTAGLAIGFVRAESEGAAFDATMAVALGTWALYAGFVALRYGVGWRGRRTAQLALTGFTLVLILHLVITPLGHF
ncbi:MAG: cytochrome C assembly family protein [Gaiellaceae bacterium]